MMEHVIMIPQQMLMTDHVIIVVLDECGEGELEEVKTTESLMKSLIKKYLAGK